MEFDSRYCIADQKLIRFLGVVVLIIVFEFINPFLPIISWRNGYHCG